MLLIDASGVFSRPNLLLASLLCAHTAQTWSLRKSRLVTFAPDTHLIVKLEISASCGCSKVWVRSWFLFRFASNGLLFGREWRDLALHLYILLNWWHTSLVAKDWAFVVLSGLLSLHLLFVLDQWWSLIVALILPFLALNLSVIAAIYFFMIVWVFFGGVIGVLEAHLLRCRVWDSWHLIIKWLWKRIAPRTWSDPIWDLSLLEIERLISLSWGHHLRMVPILVERWTLLLAYMHVAVLSGESDWLITENLVLHNQRL